MFKDESEFKKVVDQLDIDTGSNPAHRETLRGKMLSVFNEANQQSQKPKAPHGVIRRIIMKSPIMKLAAAAVIVISIFGLTFFFAETSKSIVLADVLERVEQTGAFMYRMKMTMTGAKMSGIPDGKQEMEGAIVISNEYGMKWEMNITDPNTGEQMTTEIYIIPEQKVMLSLMPAQKKYMRMEFEDDYISRMKKQNNDPREIIKQLMGCEYTELGRSVIDGVEVEGFKTTDPQYAMGMAEDINTTLWVDVKTWLPLLLEMDIKMNEQMSMKGVVYDYQWNIPVDADEFKPVIPDDYTAFPTDGMKMPSMNEETALEGLKFFADISGKYPKKVDLMSLMQEFEVLKDKKDLTEVGKKLSEEMELLTNEEQTKKVMEIMQPVQSLGMFYMMLMQDKKEPAYYGQSVGPDDAEAVLMRWKVSEGQYRVIFGDLSARDVSSDELTQLEKLTPK
jgi:outer membrane lipoprotein-sorting protein